MDEATIKAVMADYGRRATGAKKRRPKAHYQRAALKSWTPKARAKRKAAQEARNNGSH